MRYLLVLFFVFLLQGCGSMPQHHGQIPSDYSLEENKNVNPGDFSQAAELICASGETQFYFIGYSKPQLSVSFSDQGFSFFGNNYTAVKLNPGVRSMRFTFRYRDSFANFNVNNFKFEPNTKYYAKYSTVGRGVRMWIEKEDGEVVYGRRTEDGQF